jgi:hypothetical protein
MKIEPQKQFDSVPASFTEESRLTAVVSSVNGGGIIFDDLKEIEHALRVYNGEINIAPALANETNTGFINHLEEQGGGLGVAFGLLAIENERQGNDFVGTIMAEAKSNLATKGKYFRDFDYDGMGSNFMKTSITIEKVKGKFLLEINAAYVGDTPKYELAALLDRPVAIANIRIILNLSIVDDWWYNVNIESLLSQIIPRSEKESWIRTAEILADHNDPSFKFYPRVFDYDFEQTVFMHHPLHCKNKNGKNIQLVKAVNGYLSGASWNPYGKDHKPQEQELILVLRLAGTDSDNLAVDEKERLALTSLAKKIKNQLLTQVKI